jgi:hypothetical protein
MRNRKNVFKLFLTACLCFLGSSMVASKASAQEIDAYKYVTDMCHGPLFPLWSDAMGAEFKNMGATFLEGLIESTWKTDEFVTHVAKDHSTKQMRALIDNPDFVRGVFACYPNSEIKRNLLALRIILSSSMGYAAGAGVGFFGGMKLLGLATKALGSTVLPVLRYVGFSDRALIIMKKAGVGLGIVVVGGVVYGEVDEAIARYKVMNAPNKLNEENQKEIEELNELETEILSRLKSPEDQAAQAKLEGQLQQVRKLMQDRKDLAS